MISIITNELSSALQHIPPDETALLSRYWLLFSEWICHRSKEWLAIIHIKRWERLTLGRDTSNYYMTLRITYKPRWMVLMGQEGNIKVLTLNSCVKKAITRVYDEQQKLHYRLYHTLTSAVWLSSPSLKPLCTNKQNAKVMYDLCVLI